MKRLRTIHLYLGCLFGPLLIFFAISGIWQTLKLHLAPDSRVLAIASTIHTSRELKTPLSTLSSPMLQGFAIAMALGLVVTAIIGIVMALRFGRSRRAVLAVLAAGFMLPAALILMSWLA